MIRKTIIKYSLISVGILLVCIGLIGIVVPGLPTTIFLILAAACFANSSPTLHDKLINHKWFGPILKNWQETRSIPKKAKIIALVMIAISYGYTCYSVDEQWLLVLVGLIILLPVIYIIRMPLSEYYSANNKTED